MSAKDWKSAGNERGAHGTHDELSIEDLDRVVGGTGPMVALARDEEILTGGGLIAPPIVVSPGEDHGGSSRQDSLAVSNIVLPLFDDAGLTAAGAAQQLSDGRLDAAHAVAKVETGTSGTSQVQGLTDLLEASHGNKDIAAALRAELEGGALGENLAGLIKAGKLDGDGAVTQLQRAVDALEKLVPDGETPTDGLFEMSVARLYQAAQAQGDADLVTYLRAAHDLDVRSGLVEIAADKAADDIAAGRLTVDAAIARLAQESKAQSLPQDVGLTALLVQTDGNAAVAKLLGDRLNGGPFPTSHLAAEVYGAVVGQKLGNDDALEIIRESIDALARFAPGRVEGTADMNFAEAVASLNSAAWNDGAFRVWLQKEHPQELALGTVLLNTESALRTSGIAEAIRIGEFYCWQQGLPAQVATMALLADTGGDPAMAARLATHLNDGSWSTPSTMVQNLQWLMQEEEYDAANRKPAHINLQRAADVIKEAVDVLAKYAPNQIHGSAYMQYCETLVGLQWGQGQSSFYNQDLRKTFGYEVKLGEVAAASEYGITYANTAYKNAAAYHPEGIFAGEFNALYWTKNNGVPDIYAYLSVLGDVRNGTQGGATLVAQHLSDGLISGALEKNVATLVAQGKITAEQGVESLLEAVDTLARMNGLPANVTAAALRAYAFDTLADEAGALGKAGESVVGYLKEHHASELNAGQAIDRVLAGRVDAESFTSAAVAAANAVTAGSMAADLNDGRSIQEVMAKSSLSGQQAQTFLLQMAQDGLVPLQTVSEQLQVLVTSHKLDATAVMDRIGSGVSDGSLKADTAVVLLAELGSRSGVALREADDIIDGFVAGGKISPTALLECLHSAVLGHTLTDQQALGTLALLAGSDNRALGAGASQEIAALVQRGHADVGDAIAAIHAAATNGLLTGAAASSILLTLASTGGTAAQIAVGAELALIAPGAFTAAIHDAAATNLLTGEAALAVLSGAATNGGAAVQAAANAEIAALIRGGEITAKGAIITLTQVAAGADGATQGAVNGGIAAIVGAGLVSATDAVQVLVTVAAGASDATQYAVGEEIHHLVRAGRMSAAQACQAMTAMASAGSAAVQVAIGVEMASLFAQGVMDVNQFWGHVWNSGLQPSTSTKFWTVMSAMMAEAGPNLLPLLANHSQNLMRGTWGMAGIAAAAVDAAVTSHALTGAQGAEALASMIMGFGSAATNKSDGSAVNAMNALGGELANLVAHDHVTAQQGMSELIRVAMPYGLSMPLLMTVAGTNPEMQAGAGEAIAQYAQQHKIPAVQVATMIGGSGIQDPQTRLCLWAGIAAEAPAGELRDLADRNITSMVYPQQTSFFNENANPGLVEAGGLDPESAIRILAGLGSGDNAGLRSVALREIADLVWSPASPYTQGLPAEHAIGVLAQMAARGDASMQAFAGAALAAMVADGVPPDTVVDSVTNLVLQGRLSAGQMLTMVTAAGEDGTASLRNAIADGILKMVDYGRISGAQLQAFMGAHVADGLTQSILVSQVIRGALAPDAVLARLDGLIGGYAAGHPSVDKAALTNVALAELMIAVRDAADEYPPRSTSGSWTTRDFIAHRLGILQDQIEGNKAVMGQVLTGLGMMQLHQTTAAGSNEVLLITREAIQAYVLEASGANAVKEFTEKTAADAARFFTNGWDWATTGSKAESKQGIFRNQVLADPSSYEAWTNFGAAMLSGPVIGAFINEPLDPFNPGGVRNSIALMMVNAGSKLLVELFQQSAVVNALGPTAAAALGAPAGLVSASCDALTGMVTGVMKVGVGSAIETASNMVMMFDDIHHGRNASAHATQMGKYLVTTLSGVQASDARATGENFAAMWSDIFTGQNASASASGFANGFANMVWTNNGYVNAAISGLTTGANAVAGAAVTAANAVADAGQSAVNTIRSWFSSWF